MASAYSVFANGGSRITPYAIRKINTAAGETLEQYGPNLSPAVPEAIALSMRSVMMEVVRSGTGTRARVPGYEVFGKTGTTNDYTDAWFAGGIPGLVVVVYAGNDDNKTLGRPGTGGVVAAPVWQAFVSKAVKHLTLRESFEIPERAGIDTITVCRDSGFLSAGSCPSTAIFLPSGLAPYSTCPIHGGSWIMTESDRNEPRMLLSPRDEEVLGIPARMARLYSISISGIAAAPPMEELPTYQPPQMPTYTPPSPPATTPVTPSRQSKPRERTPEEIEDRYQELLKQYGISD